MKRLVIIDGHAILYRAFHALPITLTAPDGKPVNAVYGFIRMLLKTIQDLKPTHLIVCFDRPKPTFRKKIFKDYQIKRPKAPDDLIAQIGLVHQVVEVMGIPIYEKDGYEADDVIGTLVKQARSKWDVRSAKWETDNLKFRSEKCDKDFSPQKPQEIKKSTSKKSHLSHHTSRLETIIVTGDKDILQLVDENTRVYMPVKGLSLSRLYGKKDVKEKFGIESEQMVDYKALIGDPSDNYAGVKGIGPKTAADLLGKFGSLEEIYKATKQSNNKLISKKVIEALEKDKEQAEMAKKLAQIITNVPVKLNLDKAQLRSLDKLEVRELFEKLEFKSLIKKLSEKKTITQMTQKKDTENTEKREQLSLI